MWKSFRDTTNLGDTGPDHWGENIKLQQKKTPWDTSGTAINLKIDFKGRKNKAYSRKEILNLKQTCK